jgi:hypothetical protein
MKCPNCNHATRDTALIQCSHCGEYFERGPLEEFQHLKYLTAWLAARPEISDTLKEQLLGLAGKRQETLLEQLLPKPKVIEKPEPAPVLRVTAPGEIKQENVAPPALPVTVAEPRSESVTPIAKAPQPAAPLVKPVPPQPRPAPKIVQPRPARPSKPKRPPIDWRKVITEAATSGALLRALLYLGAFMIVVSAAVLVIRFWNQFNPVLQLLFIASVPLTFYAGGWALRTRLKLTQAGTVLTGIGAILVAVDFAAIYQLSGVGQNNGALYWLIVTIFCTALYAFTAWRLRGEFFDYLTLIGAGSIVFTFTRLLALPTEWSVASVAASGALMTVAARRYWEAGDNWREFARSARYLSQILMPASLFYVMFSPAQPPVGQMLGFLFATLGYSVLAWQFPLLVFAYAALGASLGTVVFALQVVNVPIEWYGTVASILAPAYILVGRRVRQAKLAEKVIQNYVQALNTTGLLLIGLAVISGLVFASYHKVWAGITAMTLASLDLAICAYLFARSRYTALAAGLFIIPFSIAVMQWLDKLGLPTALVFSWLAFAWNVLALAYIGLGAALQKHEHHNRWLYAWAHSLAPMAFLTLPFAYLLDASHWTSPPLLIALAASILVYLLSFILQDSGRHASLSAVSNWLPYGLGKSIFLWPLGALLPLWMAVAWPGAGWAYPWLGAALTGFALAYVGVGQWLLKRAQEYRFPFHVFAYLLCIAGVFTAASNINSFFVALLLTVISAGLLAYIYQRVIETTIASLLFVWPFQLLMEIVFVPSYAQILGLALLASLSYIPSAIYLNKFERSRKSFHPVPLFSTGYALLVYAVGESILYRGEPSYSPWIGVMVALIATATCLFSAFYFKNSRYAPAWAWAASLTFAIGFGQALSLFKVPAAYDALAWVIFAAFYVISERTLFFNSQKESKAIRKFWSGLFHQPLVVFAVAFAQLGLMLSWPVTLRAFTGIQIENYIAPISAQVAIVLLAIISARLYHQRWLFFIEPFLAFLAATLFFVGYGKQVFGQPLTTPQYALIWTALGASHVLAAIFTDRLKVRYAQGLFFGGYMLLSWAVLWTLIEPSLLVWTLGCWILASVVSAVLVHFRRHQTWEELIHLLFAKSEGWTRATAHNAFQWLAAWMFPIWSVVFLRAIQLSSALSWLGLVVPALAYLGLILWLRRVNSSYAIPLSSAAQFYTAIGILISAPATFEFLIGHTSGGSESLVAFIILQATAVLFYAASAWLFKSPGFAHISAWLSIIPFTVAWKIFGPAFTSIQLVIPWLMWATTLLVIGFALDRKKVRYSHAAYFAGYTLAAYALARSTPDRLTNIYALVVTISLALISHLLVHFGRHPSFEYFIARFWEKVDEITRQIASTFFLFFAAYTLPVLLMQLLAYLDYPLAWRGVALALAAPLYIATGLVIHRSKSRGLRTVPTWALYSAGYVLTALGAMVVFEDEQLATYVLLLNTSVYAASAYIFRQSFWLYLSTVLMPIIGLLILHQTERFESTWVAWVFMVLAFIYLTIGQLFDRVRERPSTRSIVSAVHPFAVPFYAPGFFLSAVALAVASSDRMLALQIYPVGVMLYGLSAYLFRETLFLYPAAWLTAVPYYLLITLTGLETRWYGLAWLPLIILYIAVGRIFFHKQPLAPLGKGVLVQWLLHPAVPFYVLAYALSVSMISLSYIDPLAITLAFGIAAILYFSSAFLFRRPGWIYPSLFAAHMGLLTYFTINPKGGEAYLLSLPFHALTWVMALLGQAFSRRSEKFLSSEKQAGNPPLVGRLVANAWSRPFFLFALIDILLWQTIALNGYETTIVLGIGHALLLALFSILWMESLLVYGVVGFGLLAVSAALEQAEVPLANAVAVYSGIGFGLYLLGRLLEAMSARFKSLTEWLSPLNHSALVLTALGVVINLLFLTRHMTAAAATLAFAGALYITMAYRNRQYVLGYVGMALLEIAWAILLSMNDVGQPQFYAIPAGLYFMGMGYLELRRHRRRYGVAVDILGLSVLLVTSFAQSLNGTQGFPYFVLLLFEALLVIWWGTVQRRKIPFFAGIAASALNILAQVIVLVSVYDINRWLVAFAVGVLITGLAIYIERGREQLRSRFGQWSETLEAWE